MRYLSVPPLKLPQSRGRIRWFQFLGQNRSRYRRKHPFLLMLMRALSLQMQQDRAALLNLSLANGRFYSREHFTMHAYRSDFLKASDYPFEGDHLAKPHLEYSAEKNRSSDFGFVG